MSVGEICNREVIVVQRDDSALQAAKIMRQHHVGEVLVVNERNGRRIPVGIVTDHDLVMEILAPELDATVITVGDIMSTKLATVKGSDGVFDAIRYMQDKGLQRLPVVDDGGGLIGTVTLDDLLAFLAGGYSALPRPMERE